MWRLLIRLGGGWGRYNYTTQLYYDTWASLFHLIFNEDEWPIYDGRTIVPPESMKRIGS